MQDIPSSCPTRIPGFIFLPAANYRGMFAGYPYIQYANSNNENETANIAAACLRTPGCKAFANWGGTLYTALPEEYLPSTYQMFKTLGPCVGVYMRASATTRGEHTSRASLNHLSLMTNRRTNVM